MIASRPAGAVEAAFPPRPCAWQRAAAPLPCGSVPPTRIPMQPSHKLSPIPALIFASRWLQLPLYLGLILAQGVYVFLFGKELWHLIHEAPSLGEQQIMLIVLGLIDVVMISNLLVMVIVGGYETFVSRLGLEGHPDQPEWLSHVNASVLKVKLALSIIGISSIHLLKTFIAAGSLGGMPMCAPEVLSKTAGQVGQISCGTLTEQGVLWQTIIHCVFILSAIGIAWTDRLMSPPAHGRNAAH